MDINRQRRILAVNGLKHRERQINLAKDGVIKQSHESPSFFVVEVGDKTIREKREVLITSTRDVHIKNIVALPISNNDIYAGDYVDWKENKWLITQIEPNDEIYTSGLMKMCNYTLKWQDNNSVIFNYPVVVEGNSGTTTENNLIKIGDNQLIVYIRYDKNTNQITRGKRFFIDRNKENPKPYKVTNIDNVRYVINDCGYIILTVDEDVIVEGKDNIDMFICDYNEFIIPQEYQEKMSKIIHNDNTLICDFGDYIVFDYKFLNNNIEIDELTPIWNVTSISNDKLKIKEDNGKLYLACDDYSMVGENIKIELSCKEDDEYSKSEITIEVISMF